MLREIAIGLLIPLALIWGLLSAQGSVLVLNWIWFQRPYEFSWGLWATLPAFKIALAVAIFSNLIRGEFRPRMTPLLAVYLLFLGWLTVSAALAYDTQHAWNFYAAFLPSMWISPVVMLAIVHDLRLLKLVFWVAAGGIGLNAAKTGLVLTLAGGAVLNTGNSGFVGDNNVIALTMCMVVAVLIGLRGTLPDRRLLRGIYWIGVGLILLAIVYTRSRGAYLALGTVFLLGAALGPKPVRDGFLVLVLAAVAYAYLPEDNFARLSTIRDYKEDVSAMGRIENWKLAWEAAVRHPMFGVGVDNHIPYYTRLVQPGVQVRVAHSVYFQVLGELGFPALALYLTFLVGSLVSLYRTWRLALRSVQTDPEFQWVADLALWSFCAVAGFAVGAMFLNMLYIEFPWMVMFYGILLGILFRQQLKEQTDQRGAHGRTKTLEAKRRLEGPYAGPVVRQGMTKRRIS